MTQQILAATDFSESSDAALAVAVRMARALHAGLHVLHVVTGRESDVTRLLADAAAGAGPDVPVKVASTRGDAAQEILRYAAEQRIELIVLGTHGRTGLSRFLLGSVAERVVRGARCPVVVVPAVAEAPAPAPAELRAAPGEAPPERRCIVCTTPTPDLICEPCRNRIRGEAVDRKQREERPGRA